MEQQPAAMEMAEEAREKIWEHPSFVGELFMGNLRTEGVLPFPEQSTEDKLAGDLFLNKLEAFCKKELDADAVDEKKELPPHVLQGLKDLGCFGIKIPKEYGGLGLSQLNYNRAISLISSHCVNSAVWLSAHQSIGVPTPLKMFGTAEQKKKYLPRLAKGAVSAFALTEPAVGSDPAQMTTTATLTEDGQHYIIEGEKLWCTNGPVAELLIVMALTAPKKITAFIVEGNSPGFETVHRCDFMGLKGIQNGLLRFNKVKVPKENIIGTLGGGLKLALTTLNTGRLTLPASCTGGAKQALALTRRWALDRVQWGTSIGKHDAVAGKLAWMASHLFAMESMTWFSSQLVDQGGFDIRLEAAMTKLFGSETAWKLADEAMQIHGGRGYETAQSLRARGEKAYPIERMMRDARINLIIEGSSEIMRLFIAREFLDKHMRLAASLLDSNTPLKEKLATALKAGIFYCFWYPRQWFFWSSWPKFSEHKLGRYLRYVDRRSHRVARSIFHILMLHRLGLQKRQRILARLVNIGMDLFAMTVTCSRAEAKYKQNPLDKTPLQLADHFCREAKLRISQEFRGLFCNQDKSSYRIAQQSLDGKMDWLEDEIVPFD